MKSIWIRIGLTIGGLLFLVPINGLRAQLAVAVVADVPETLTNIQRFQQYALQAEQFLREAEYWMETGAQLHSVIDHLGTNNSFWAKVEAGLDGVDVARGVSVKQDWGEDWYPDAYLRLTRETNRFGQEIHQTADRLGEVSEVGEGLRTSQYLLGSAVAYVSAVEGILEELGTQDEEFLEKVHKVAGMEVTEEEGLAGILEKSTALQWMELVSASRTQALQRTQMQAQLEEFAHDQMQKLAEWEYQFTSEEAALRDAYEGRNAQLQMRTSQTITALEQERQRMSRPSSGDQTRSRFRVD